MSIVNLPKELQKIEMENPFDFSLRSSIGVGGEGIAFYPKSIPEISALLCFFSEKEIPYKVLGNLTNVLPSNDDFAKIVISTKKLNGIQGGNGLFAEAGVMSGSFLNACRCAKKTGGEFLVGIPCTLGGALYMNAGVKEGYIAEIVDSVLVWREGKTTLLSVEECGYSYKNSVFMQNNDVILGATFRLKEGSIEEIEEKKRTLLEKRAHLPKGKSMGCVFKNPKGMFAGKLIENAGLKGTRIGGALLSETHANFILNDKKATASDIRLLIELIKKTVFEKYTIRLEEEIEYLE